MNHGWRAIRYTVMGGFAHQAKRCNRVVEFPNGTSNPATLIFASPKIGNSFERHTDAGTRRDLAALEYALTVLSDDWFELAAGLEVCSLKTSSKGSEAIPLSEWA
jgi:hypothetical protein